MSGETIVRQSAKRTYDGTIAPLKTISRTIELDTVILTRHDQISSTGSADIPHTSTCTVVRVTIVQAIRHATTARRTVSDAVLFITGFHD